MVKILNATDEHVMALGANFSLQADSHLVYMQNEQGYKTQAINIQNQARKGNLPLMLKLLYIYFLFNMCMSTVNWQLELSPVQTLWLQLTSLE